MKRTAQLITVLALLACGVVFFGSCSPQGQQTAADLGKAAGVVKDSSTIEFPAAELRAFVDQAAGIATSACDRKLKLCKDSKKPGAACKLPAKDCAASEDRCAEVDILVDKATREVTKPNVTVDVQGTARLIGQLLSIVKEIAP